MSHNKILIKNSSGAFFTIFSFLQSQKHILNLQFLSKRFFYKILPIYMGALSFKIETLNIFKEQKGFYQYKKGKLFVINKEDILKNTCSWNIYKVSGINNPEK